jgi:hypothetical protein
MVRQYIFSRFCTFSQKQDLKKSNIFCDITLFILKLRVLKLIKMLEILQIYFDEEFKDQSFSMKTYLKQRLPVSNTNFTNTHQTQTRKNKENYQIEF